MNAVIERLENLLSKGHDTVLLRFGLAHAYIQVENFTHAIAQLQIALEKDPNYSAAWKLYGQALTKIEQIDAAIVAYEQGIIVAEKKGDKQIAEEMKVFLKRLLKKRELL